MFFVKDFSRTVSIHPKYFGKETPEHIVKASCYMEIEGRFLPSVGYVCCIIRVSNIQGGIIQPHFGLVDYRCNIKAVILKPLVGEIIDVEVTRVDSGKVFFVYCGFVHGLINFLDLSDHREHYVYQEAAAGELPFFRCTYDESKNLKKGVMIRTRVSKVSNAHGGLLITASCADGKSYLGVKGDTTVASVKVKTEKAFDGKIIKQECT